MDLCRPADMSMFRAEIIYFSFSVFLFSDYFLIHLFITEVTVGDDGV